VITTAYLTPQTDLGMPLSALGSAAVANAAAAVCTLPATGGVSIQAAAKRRGGDVAPVCAVAHIADVAFRFDTTRGTPAWSPPT
jgi:hypothetical protein